MSAQDTDNQDTDDKAAEATGEGAEEEAERDELREQLLKVFTDVLGDQVVGSHIYPGQELWVRVTREAWAEAADIAKLRLRCTFFDFLSAIDWMPSPWGRYEDDQLDLSAMPLPDPEADMATGLAGGDTRFQVFARLSNVREHYSVILKTDLPGTEPGEDDFSIASLVPAYAGANWHERECWEMFGITFHGHPGLRHLYLPGAFEGYPLRKDYPLVARMVKPWPGVVDVEPMPEQPDSGAGAENAEDAESSDGGSS